MHFVQALGPLYSQRIHTVHTLHPETETGIWTVIQTLNMLRDHYLEIVQWYLYHWPSNIPFYIYLWSTSEISPKLCLKWYSPISNWLIMLIFKNKCTTCLSLFSFLILSTTFSESFVGSKTKMTCTNDYPVFLKQMIERSNYWHQHWNSVMTMTWTFNLLISTSTCNIPLLVYPGVPLGSGIE